MHFAENYFRLLFCNQKNMTEKEFAAKIQLLVSLCRHTIS